jgi:xanthine dehydrogenase accessory factor
LAIPRDDYARIEAFHAAGEAIVIVRVTGVRGSAPRGEDAVMAVTAGAIAGTVGGGQLEWIAIARARQMLESGETQASLDVPLGPEIGQCCGGRMALSLSRLDDHLLEEVAREAQEEEQSLRHALVFGAGHTGKALARALEPLPLKTMLVDTRPEAFEGVGGRFESRCVAMPEELVRKAPAGSAFIMMTHSHSLDFLITAEALARADAAYCGMIGSATKRAVFAGWLEDHGHDRRLAERLVCPIGGSAVRDKRPEVIAALTAAEILTALHADGMREIT